MSAVCSEQLSHCQCVDIASRVLAAEGIRDHHTTKCESRLSPSHPSTSHSSLWVILCLLSCPVMSWLSEAEPRA